eukprot:scaffold170002_cov14-Tisochrysis_lutea.AAC.2
MHKPPPGCSCPPFPNAHTLAWTHQPLDQAEPSVCSRPPDLHAWEAWQRLPSLTGRDPGRAADLPAVAHAVHPCPRAAAAVAARAAVLQ